MRYRVRVATIQSIAFVDDLDGKEIDPDDVHTISWSWLGVDYQLDVSSSNLEYCVVLENVTIKDVERLEESLVGKNAKVTKNQKNRTIKLHIGDYSEVEV